MTGRPCAVWASTVRRRPVGKPSEVVVRVDLLDLRYGAELGGLDLVLLLGWGSGRGATVCPMRRGGGTGYSLPLQAT